MEDGKDKLARARAAKERAKGVLADVSEVAGIGLSRRGGEVGVRVNLSREPGPGCDLPQQIDGVHVSYRIVGRVRAQAPDRGEDR